ncbi:MAG: hypothetical protein EXQ92_10630 [Alphaproteobacteria bacterium]|nr:hypothetical protein [Alphaproteobacteria bacterium]
MPTTARPTAKRTPEVMNGTDSGMMIFLSICTSLKPKARPGVLITPQYVFGQSYNEFVVRRLQRRWIPGALRRRITRAITFMVHGRPTDLGFKPLTHRVHPTTSATIVADISFGRVAVKQGIERIEGCTLHFVDGSREAFDEVVAATGFDMEFSFLPSDVVGVADNRIDLFKRVIAPGWPGLYFIGIVNLDTPINYACERQALWVRELETGNVLLPSRGDMMAGIAAKHRWVERHYGTALRHTVQEGSMIYYAELRSELWRGRRRYMLQKLLALFGDPKRVENDTHSHGLT